jgi:hypothetical protein
LIAFQHFKNTLPEQAHHLSVVFDIDNTLLNVQGTILSPLVLMLYNLFLQRGVRIYIVTARPNLLHTNTLTQTQLLNAGIYHYNQIFYLPTILHDVAQFKATMRAQLAPLLFTIGDHWTDIVRSHVPNLFDHQSFWLHKAEPHCEWALKLIPENLFFASDMALFQTPLLYGKPYLDSVFDTVAPD